MIHNERDTLWSVALPERIYLAGILDHVLGPGRHALQGGALVLHDAVVGACVLGHGRRTMCGVLRSTAVGTTDTGLTEVQLHSPGTFRAHGGPTLGWSLEDRQGAVVAHHKCHPPPSE